MADITTHSLQDAVTFSSRTITPEGFLRGSAAVTRVGVLEYDAAKLGVGDAGHMVRVYQTPESVFHQQTIASVRGAPVTVGHPPMDVTPDSWRTFTVGNIVGEPSRISDGRLGADILIGDGTAIKRLQSGEDELSIGKRVRLMRPRAGAKYDWLTDGPILVNHVAVVESGRAGPDVRIFDARGDHPLTTDELGQLGTTIKSAITDALKPNGTQAPQAVDATAVAGAVTTAITPVLDGMKKMMEEKAKKDKDADDKKMKDAQEAAANTLIAATQAATLTAERSRVDVLTDCLPLIPEANRAALRDSAPKDILIAAIGDSLENAKDYSEDFLRGYVKMLADQRGRATHTPPAPGTPRATPLVGDAAIEKARTDYLAHLRDGHQGGSK